MKYLLFCTCLLLSPALTRAHDDAPIPGTGEQHTVEERLQALEAHQTELYHTLEEKKAAGLDSAITDRLTVSGLIEVEAAASDVASDDGSSDAASDLTLATVQLGLGISLNEIMSGDVSLLFEEGAFGADDTDLEIDEAALNFAHGPWSGRVGRQYLPFGVFHSHFISDPLTLALGETRETAVLAGYAYGPAALKAFAFNGDAEKTGEEDHIRDWGASLVLTPAEGVEVGGSYLSDLADSDAELLEEYTRRVGGWSAFAHLERGRLTLDGEVLGASKRFAASDLDSDGDGRGDRPLAWNLEVAWTPVEDVELALRYEGSDEFAGQPERQYGADVSWSPWEHTTLSLEYLHGEFDRDFSADDDGNVLDRQDLVTAQLAFEF